MEKALAAAELTTPSLDKSAFSLSMSLHSSTAAQSTNSTSSGGLSLPFCNESCSWTAVLAISSVLSAVAVVINVCVIAVIQRTPEMRRQSYSVLMVNLCVSNIVSSLLRGILSNCGMLVFVSYTIEGCYFADAVYTLTTFVSLSTISVMSFDRFLGIAYHLRYGVMITPLKYNIFIIVQWVVCTALAILPMFSSGTRWCVRRFGGCSYTNGGYVVFVHAIVVYAPCAMIILFSYIRIWMVIRRLTSSVASERKERIRGVRTTVIILTAFVVSTLPRLVAVLTLYTAGSREHISADATNGVEDATSLFLGLNAFASPLIYSLTNRTFKDRLTRMNRAARRYSISTNSHEEGSQRSVNSVQTVLADK